MKITCIWQLLPFMKIAAILFSRSLLFAFFQGLLALLFSSWTESEKYWMLSATLTNLVSIIILIILLRKEEKKLLSIFQFNSLQWKKDLLLFFGLAIITIPFVMLPSYYLNLFFYGNSDHYSDIMFQPISKSLIYILLFVFCLSVDVYSAGAMHVKLADNEEGIKEVFKKGD